MGITDDQIALLAQQSDTARQWQTKGHFRREHPATTVTMRDYCIGKYPVTVGAYRSFLTAKGYAHQQYWTESGWYWREENGITAPLGWNEIPWTEDDRYPVVGVSWYETMAYCRWLSDVSGQSYRLPMEAEWEYAARDAEDWLFPWGDTFDAARCNMRESAIGHQTPVGQYSPAGDSPFGCVDMAGNASEWTDSLFRPYPYNIAVGRNDPVGAGERVTRGGSWHSPMLRVRTVSRGMNMPDFRDTDLGFRVCAPSG